MTRPTRLKVTTLGANRTLLHNVVLSALSGAVEPRNHMSRVRRAPLVVFLRGKKEIKMTVADLIAKLQQLPRDLEAVVYQGDFIPSWSEPVKSVKTCAAHCKDGCYVHDDFNSSSVYVCLVSGGDGDY